MAGMPSAPFSCLVTGDGFSSADRVVLAEAAVRTILDVLLRRFIVLGRLTIRWPDGRITTYTGEPGPEAVIAFADWTTVRRFTLRPSLAFGEGFMEGGLMPVDCTIYEVLDLFMSNIAAETSFHLGLWVQQRWATSGCTSPIPIQDGRARLVLFS